MLKKAIAILTILFPLFAAAQNRLLLDELLATSKNPDSKMITSRIEEFEQGIKTKKHSSDYTFLRTVFNKTQQKFLKHYSQYVDLTEIFSNGKYDCLTATSLFSIVLSDLRFQYRIVETNYHIFLLVQTTNGEVLIETTDRFNGFVSEKKDIEERLGSYKQNSITSTVEPGKFCYAYHFSLYQDVKSTQLAGLLYYNQAVIAFNRGELVNCADLLEKSKSIYDSPRIAELAIVITGAVLESNLDESTKLLILNRYKEYWEQRSRFTAAR